MNPNRIPMRLVFVAGVLLIDFLSVIVFTASNQGPSSDGLVFLIGSFTGFLMGQIAFALVWSGFLCQTWTRSFFQALGLAGLASYVLILAVCLRTPMWPGSTIFYMPLVLPLYAVAGNLSLWIARHLRGWRFESTRHSVRDVPTTGIEDILHLTAIVAASLMLSRTVSALLGGVEVLGSNTAWLRLLVSAAIFGLLSTPITLLNARICTSRRTEDRFAMTCVLAILTFSLFAFALLGMSGGNAPGDVIAVLVICCLFGYGTLWVGLTAIITDGFQFSVLGKPIEKQDPTESNGVTSNPNGVTPQSTSQYSPFEETPTVSDVGKIPRALDRTLVAGFVLLVVLFSTSHNAESPEERAFKLPAATTPPAELDETQQVDSPNGMDYPGGETETMDKPLEDNTKIR